MQASPSPVNARRASLRVGVLGAGSVGREVVHALLTRPQSLWPSGGHRLELVAVAARDLARHRAAGIPEDLLTDAPAHVVASPDVDVVVELMGGDEPARTLMLAALGAGKPVVTANKHVLAHHGPAFEAAVRRMGAAFRFEAAVGGGLPILAPLAFDLAANRVDRIRGIVNGTTNYILSTMEREGCAYADALAAAQSSGYAEADPTADVEGDDAVNKAVILARLAFGAWVAPGAVPRHPPSLSGRGRPGITGVSIEDVRAAGVLGLTIRLLAVAERADDPDADPRVRVLPAAVPLDRAFGRTTGVVNRIEIDAEPLGRLAVDGPGAGGASTSSAVLADLMAIARGDGSSWAGLPSVTERREAVGRLVGHAELRAASSGWFAYLPGVSPRKLGSESVGLYAVEAPGGVAVRTAEPSLVRVRSFVQPLVGPSSDVHIYPVEE
jgi:homoserine dehydrogenase